VFVNLRVCDIPTFIERVKGKRVLCFGAGNYGELICRNFPDYHLEKTYTAFTDSNPVLWGQMKILNLVHLRREILPILSLSDWRTQLGRDAVILITATIVPEIISQLELYPETASTECYVAPWLVAFELDNLIKRAELPPNDWRMNTTRQIPKVIHYTWFSEEPIPKHFRHCMNSWKKFCPEYKIVQWNSKNYDLSKHPYMKAARKEKKWTYVADYARLDIVYKHGGIYLDCDVELLKSLDDLLYNSAFIGFEGISAINLGSGFGAVEKFPLIREMLEEYDDVPFVNNERKFDTTIISPAIQTKTIIRHNLKLNGCFQTIEELAVYPAIFFSPKRWDTGLCRITTETFSIHHYDASWVGKDYYDDRKKKYDLLAIAVNNEELYQ
jgi:hypothetical protein